MTRMVQFAETDLAGVMHFSNFFRIMEETEHAFWRSVGAGVHQVDEKTGVISWPRVSARCDYKAAVGFEETLTVSLSATRIGAKSVTYRIAFTRDGELIATGEMSAVCCRIKPGGRFESIPIAADARKALQSIASDGA